MRQETQVSIHQFGFMPDQSTTEVIHVLERLMEKYMERKRDLHMVFINLEKAYDTIQRLVIWDTLERRELPQKYIYLSKGTYDNTLTSVSSPVRDTYFFLVEMGLH